MGYGKILFKAIVKTQKQILSIMYNNSKANKMCLKRIADSW